MTHDRSHPDQARPAAPVNQPPRAPLLHPEKWIAVVLCAGLGTRLRPLTRYVPKTAVPIGDFPLAFHSIKALLDAGVGQVHCNTHYLAPFVEEELSRAANAAGLPPGSVRFWREEPILETGGGVARIARELASERPGKPPRDVLVVSGDIHGEIPLLAMVRAWEGRDPSTLALMCTREAEKGRSDVTWIDPTGSQGNTGGRVVGFGKDRDPAEGFVPRNFSNHQVVAGELAMSAPIVKKSSIDLFYRAALAAGGTIAHVEHPPGMRWFNVGTYREYQDCVRSLGDAPKASARVVPGLGAPSLGAGNDQRAHDHLHQPDTRADEPDRGDQRDQAPGDDHAPPDHCLVFAPTHEETGEGALTLPGVSTLRLPLRTWPFAALHPGLLRTFPTTESGEGFASVLLSFLASSAPMLPGCTSGSPLASDLRTGSGNLPSSSLDSPGTARSPVVLRLEAPSSWELSHPFLVPLEVFEARSPPSLDSLTALYEAGETFFLLTPARWRRPLRHPTGLRR